MAEATSRSVLYATRPDALDARLRHVADLETVLRSIAANEVAALVVDARSGEDFFRAHELLRILLDNPKTDRRLDPRRVLALVADGDVEAAFSFGRYGIAGVIASGSAHELRARLERASATAPRELLDNPLEAPHRPTLLTFRDDGELPTVTLAYRHPAETLSALERYVHTLRARGTSSTVFADAATLIEVMVAEGLTCQTNLATKAGVAHGGQFIGSFEFYTQLRRTRYGAIEDHPTGAIAMDVWIAVDEVVHEVLHLLFLANAVRAGAPPRQRLLAEEFSVSWWQAVVHNAVFPEWLVDRRILEINDDFMLAAENQDSREFWKVDSVFAQYGRYPWIPYVLAKLPERAVYIGQRPDLDDLVASFQARPEAAFLRDAGPKLVIDVPFDSYPRVPPTLSVARR